MRHVLKASEGLTGRSLGEPGGPSAGTPPFRGKAPFQLLFQAPGCFLGVEFKVGPGVVQAALNLLF